MKYFYDLHIHSCLSPCGDNDMTPNNIVNMSVLNGLDFIAVTDHNCCYNLPAVIECARDHDIVVLCGMEVETSEEVHMITLFPDLGQCQKMCEIVMNALPHIKNNEKIFGEQLVMNEQDVVVSKVEDMLVTATRLSVYDVVRCAGDLGGIAYPAHVDRDSFSIISNLGFIPEDLELTAIEISKNADVGDFLSVNHSYKKYNIIQSSDAHYLENVFFEKSFVELKEKSVHALLEHLKTRPSL